MYWQDKGNWVQTVKDFRLDIRKKNPFCAGGEALDQVSHRSCESLKVFKARLGGGLNSLV